MKTGFRKLVGKLNFGMDKFMPDSLVLAFFLTILTFIFGIVAAKQTPWQMIIHWTDGFWAFLTFSMQMFLTLAGGYFLASSPPGKTLLRKLARIPKTSLGAILFSVFFLGFLSWWNWAVGLIVAAFLAREIAANHPKLEFKLLVAVGYCVAICIGILGPSTPEFLVSADPTGYMFPYLGRVVPLTETIFDPGLLVAEILTFFVAIPILVWLVHPPKEETPEMPKEISEKFRLQDEEAEAVKKIMKSSKEMTFAEKMDNSPILTYIVCLPGVIYIVYYFATRGFDFTLNIMNFMLLIFGMLLHRTPASIVQAFQEGAKQAFGIALQFPLYAGIQGMISNSGLITIIANYFASVSTASTFQHYNYLTGMILNIFVPSSGGLYMVAGPAMAEAGKLLSLPPNQTVIAFTAGEVLSNMIQPFWAISLLSIAGLKMKDIMGYCIVFFISATLIFNICFSIFW